MQQEEMTRVLKKYTEKGVNEIIVQLNSRLQELEKSLKSNFAVYLTSCIVYFLISSGVVTSLSLGSVEIDNYDLVIVAIPLILSLTASRILPCIIYRKHIHNTIFRYLKEELGDNTSEIYHEFVSYSILSYNSLLQDYPESTFSLKMLFVIDSSALFTLAFLPIYILGRIYATYGFNFYTTTSIILTISVTIALFISFYEVKQKVG